MQQVRGEVWPILIKAAEVLQRDTTGKAFDPRVPALQEKLVQLGCMNASDVAKVDSESYQHFGPKTEAAVKLLLEGIGRSNVAVVGVDADCVNAVNLIIDPRQAIRTGAERLGQNAVRIVKALQDRLHQTGDLGSEYGAGIFYGIFGEATNKALSAFKQRAYLGNPIRSVNGNNFVTLGPSTFAALYGLNRTRPLSGGSGSLPSTISAANPYYMCQGLDRQFNPKGNWDSLKGGTACGPTSVIICKAVLDNQPFAANRSDAQSRLNAIPHSGTTSTGFLKTAAKRMGLSAHAVSDWKDVVSALREGRPVVAFGHYSGAWITFTGGRSYYHVQSVGGPHWIALVGLLGTSEGILVADPVRGPRGEAPNLVNPIFAASVTELQMFAGSKPPFTDETSGWFALSL
jgi:hypothetical protein